MVKRLKITVLVDNKPAPGLKNDWGFSAYLETEEHKILFDADTDPSVLEYNVRKLNVEIKKLEFAILSHHHYDHSGGFSYIGREIPGLTVYIPPDSGEALESWGLKPQVVEKSMEILEDIYIIGPFEAWSGFHEQALAIKVDGKGIVLVVGCSHPGADKLANEAREKIGEDIYHILGGFHKPSRAVIDNLAKFSRYISPIHCSGDEAEQYTREKYPEKFYEIRTGSVIEY
ncbi:MAG: MBL fold metallo-hydrolase [Thermofilum sp. ex4484_79]|nr:MAG: MBL fold metallo-hydrolase [Thermofilum sp. ex4484_79]